MSEPEKTSCKRPLPATLRLDLDRDLEAVADVTQAVEVFLRTHEVPPQDIMAVRLALAEASNNAAQYACKDAAPAQVEVNLDAQHVTIVVTDHTPGFDWPREVKLPDALAERGRGLYLIQATMDSVEYVRGCGGNRLILRKALARQP